MCLPATVASAIRTRVSMAYNRNKNILPAVIPGGNISGSRPTLVMAI